MQQRSPQNSGIPFELEGLMDPTLPPATFLGEQPGDPVSSPMATTQLTAEIKVTASHPVGAVLRVRQRGGELLPKLVGEALVRVKSENPRVARASDGGVPLRRNGGADPFQHQRTSLTGQRYGPIGGAGI